MLKRDFTTLRPWLTLILQRRRRLLVGGLLMSATVLSAVGLLALSGWFITATAVTGALLALGVGVTLDVFVPGGGIRAFALSRTVSRYLERLYNHDTVLRLLADLRGQAFRQLTQLDAAALNRLRAVQWLNRLTTDIDTLDNLYLRLLAPPAVAALGILVVGGLVTLFIPLAGGILMIGLLGLLLALTFGIARLCRVVSAQLTADLELLRTRTVEQLQGLGELTAFHALTHHQQLLLAQDNQVQVRQTELANRIAWANGLSNFGVQAAVILTLLIALQAYQAAWFSAPVAVMLPLAVMALGEAFAMLPKAFAHAGGTVAAAERLNQQTPEPGTQTKPNLTLSSAALQSPLKWHRIGVEYAGNWALKDCNLSLQPGETVGVIGPSGSGKSTLAALAARLQAPDEGYLQLGDSPLAEVDADAWRKHLGYLTQQSDLFNETLATNLLLGNPEASEAQLWQALEIVAFADAVKGFPDQLNTRVGEGGRQLSGGEARRIALARVILKNPDWVILDEPFSGLDRATADRIRRNLEPWLANKTALVLGHDESALTVIDRLVRL